MAKAVTPKDQRALVDRLMSACGGSYSPERRRKYFISGPQWAAAYQGQALFHAPTREPFSAGEVIRPMDFTITSPPSRTAAAPCIALS